MNDKDIKRLSKIKMRFHDNKETRADVEWLLNKVRDYWEKEINTSFEKPGQHPLANDWTVGNI